MESNFIGPINIGSEEMVSINKLVEIVSKVAEKKLKIKHIDGPLGVRGRNSDNELIRTELNWDYKMKLEEGIKKTYKCRNRRSCTCSSNWRRTISWPNRVSIKHNQQFFLLILIIFFVVISLSIKKSFQL